MDNFSKDEHAALWAIKRTVVGDDIMKSREENFPTTTKERREKLSNLFEYPEPIVSKVPVVELDTDLYEG